MTPDLAGVPPTVSVSGPYGWSRAQEDQYSKVQSDDKALCQWHNNFTHNFDRDSETSASERETQRL
jgi:hypothetical protein